MCHLCEDGLWLSPTCGWDLGFCCDSPGFFVFYSGFVGLGLFSRKDRSSCLLENMLHAINNTISQHSSPSLVI